MSKHEDGPLTEQAFGEPFGQSTLPHRTVSTDEMAPKKSALVHTESIGDSAQKDNEGSPGQKSKSVDSPPQQRCMNCNLTETVMWRKTAKGDIMCNPCGLYEKLHNKPRPPSLCKKIPRHRKQHNELAHSAPKKLVPYPIHPFTKSSSPIPLFPQGQQHYMDSNLDMTTRLSQYGKIRTHSPIPLKLRSEKSSVSYQTSQPSGVGVNQRTSPVLIPNQHRYSTPSENNSQRHFSLLRSVSDSGLDLRPHVQITPLDQANIQGNHSISSGQPVNKGLTMQTQSSSPLPVTYLDLHSQMSSPFPIQSPSTSPTTSHIPFRFTSSSPSSIQLQTQTHAQQHINNLAQVHAHTQQQHNTQSHLQAQHQTFAQAHLHVQQQHLRAQPQTQQQEQQQSQQQSLAQHQVQVRAQSQSSANHTHMYRSPSVPSSSNANLAYQIHLSQPSSFQSMPSVYNRQPDSTSPILYRDHRTIGSMSVPYQNESSSNVANGTIITSPLAFTNGFVGMDDGEFANHIKSISTDANILGTSVIDDYMFTQSMLSSMSGPGTSELLF
eukprot:CFRG1355T1